MPWQTLFADRIDAGDRLARRLGHLRSPHTVVLGLPRGGVPVAARVAAALGAPLDVIVVRKLGAPGNPEYALGAIAEGGVTEVDRATLAALGIDDDALQGAIRRERDALTRRVRRFRQGRPSVPLAGTTAVLVDDGIATGSTMRAACRAARSRGAARIVVAVPCAPPGWEDDLGGLAEECLALSTPEPYFAVNQWYRDFGQVSDDEVVSLLEPQPADRPATRGPSGSPPSPAR